MQADILDKFAEGAATITAVGDDAQAIYGFRAATVRNILEFPSRFHAEAMPGSSRASGRRRHSSPSPTPLAAEATERHDKTLWTHRSRRRAPRPRHLRRRGRAVRCGLRADPRPARDGARRCPRRRFSCGPTTTATCSSSSSSVRRHPVREVRRPEVPRSRPREGPLRVLPCRREPGRRGRLVPRAPTARRRRPRYRSAARRSPQRATWSRSRAAAATARPGRVRGRRAVLLRLWPTPAANTRSPAPRSRRSAPGSTRSSKPDTATERHASPTSTNSRTSPRAAPSLERFLVDLVLDPPASTSELAGPPLLEEDFLTLSTIHAAKGPRVGRHPRTPSRRRAHPLRHGHRRRRRDRRGTSPPLRRLHPRP